MVFLITPPRRALTLELPPTGRTLGYASLHGEKCFRLDHKRTDEPVGESDVEVCVNRYRLLRERAGINRSSRV